MISLIDMMRNILKKFVHILIWLLFLAEICQRRNHRADERIEEYGCKHVVMATRGSKGAFLRIDGKFYEQSPYLVDAVDTMAAGDSFITSF